MASSITLNPTSIDFSTVAVGSLATANENIQALGFGPFTITAVSNSDTVNFSSGISLGPLNNGDNNFPVNFTPASTGSKSDTFVISIFDNGTGNTTDFDLPVSGEGTSAPPAPVSGFVTVVSQ